MIHDCISDGKIVTKLLTVSILGLLSVNGDSHQAHENRVIEKKTKL